MGMGSPPATAMRCSDPSPLTIRWLPSRVQLGASNNSVLDIGAKLLAPLGEVMDVQFGALAWLELTSGHGVIVSCADGIGSLEGRSDHARERCRVLVERAAT